MANKANKPEKKQMGSDPHMDDVLRRMLATPPDPKKPKPAQPAKKKTAK